MDIPFSFLPMVIAAAALGISAYCAGDEFGCMSWVSTWEAAAISALVILPLEGMRQWYWYKVDSILEKRKPPDIMIAHTDEIGGVESSVSPDKPSP
jgi:hypothetical protein